MKRTLRATLILTTVAAIFGSVVKLYPNNHVAAHTRLPQFVDSACYATVPKNWGQFRGGSAQSGLAFEDSAGTLRFLTNIPCGGSPIVALEIRRVN